MTDNRTTELLREGLTEHGIEWRSGLEGVTFVGDWCFVEYDSGKLAATCEPVLTHEQAIAATLGSGTLTAEKVMAIAGKHQPDYCSDTYACFDWQAIADELNAELGSGTCYIVKTPSDSDFSDDWRYRCSECGCNIPVNERDPETGDVINAANFCPNCGKRVIA